MTETREPAETGGYASLEEDDEDLSPGEIALEVVVLTKLDSLGKLRGGVTPCCWLSSG